MKSDMPVADGCREHNLDGIVKDEAAEPMPTASASADGSASGLDSALAQLPSEWQSHVALALRSFLAEHALAMQEQQDKAIQKAVEQALDARWQRQSKLEPSIGGAVGRVELMELMVLKRDLQAQLPALATMRSTFETLTDRVKALEEKQVLLKQALEVSMQVARDESGARHMALLDRLSKVQSQQEEDARGLSRAICVASSDISRDVRALKERAGNAEVELAAFQSQVSAKLASIDKDFHEEADTIREHMRGSLRALLVDMEQNKKCIEEQADDLHKAQEAPGSNVLFHQAQSEVKALNRTMGVGLTAVSDSVSWIQGRVDEMEESQSKQLQEQRSQHKEIHDLVEDLRQQVKMLQTRLDNQIADGVVSKNLDKAPV
eukprot:CAMPEP_0114255174 /NCGR_PEP_ID=MMETSP0058-20121206/17406_1 /TAXON_ID=36894 /ORGANISM="Pyramimonas parkeae, CCMP726" /LENGTH=377 /DNA_ID=CAMNT_0001369511 /DNA_START=546 /DNA_END=1679 /DNA_ORIENTATION=+